jgi:hypothetical protein
VAVERQGWFKAAFILLALSAISLVLAPQWPGFWVTLAVAGLSCLLFYGPKAIERRLLELKKPQKAGPLKTASRLILVLVGLVFFGSFTFLPVLRISSAQKLSLPEATLSLLSHLPAEVSLTAAMGGQDSETGISYLLGLYRQASPKIKTSIIKAEGQANLSQTQAEVVEPDSVTISSDNFSETVRPISRRSIDASLRRLISPNRLILNLTGDGEKSVYDFSPVGLSDWAKSLAESKIFVKDSIWTGPNLPPEALAANALILAGPRKPLGEEREKALIEYLMAGGKLVILQDPMVVGFGASSLSPLGLNIPWGLMVEPDSTWAGTEDFFIVSRDFPAHPITLGLGQPVVWPLSGAITLTKNKAASPNAPAPEASADDASPDSLDGHDQTASAQSVGLEASGHTWAVALSSPAAWLETDRLSLANRTHRYQPEIDPAGPLVLASATSLTQGGRLFLAADSDLAANGFVNYAGNLNFLNNSVFWLLGAESDLSLEPEEGGLDLTAGKVRILFWLPVVVWPILVVGIWLKFYLRRRRATEY